MAKYKLHVCYPPGLKDLEIPREIYKDALDVFSILKGLGWKAYNFQIIERVADTPLGKKSSLQQRVENALYVLENNRIISRENDGMYRVSTFSRDI